MYKKKKIRSLIFACEFEMFISDVIVQTRNASLLAQGVSPSSLFQNSVKFIVFTGL